MLKNNSLGIKNKLTSLPTIFYVMLIVLIGRILFYTSLVPYAKTTDSESYIKFPFRSMLHLNFIGGRTPVYPLIIQICNFIAGQNYFLNLVVILQAIVSFISVFYFYKSCLLIASNTKIVYLMTILYGITPSIAGWDKTILAESFALSGTVFFLYFIINYIKEPSFKFGLASIILVFILTFLRPTFLLFDCLLLAFWIIRLFLNKKERKLLKNLILCSVGVFIIIGGYSYIFQKAHGIFSISDPMPRQNLMVCIERGYYKSSSDQEFIEMIDATKEKENNLWYIMVPVLRKFGKKRIMDLTTECISKNKGIYIKDLTKIATDISNQKFPGYYQSRNYKNGLGFLNSSFIIGTCENVFSIFKVGHAYLVGLIELIVCVSLWIKQKSPPWIHMGIATFVLLIIITTFVGTNAEYPRTMIHVLPFMYLSLTLFLNWFAEHHAHKILKLICGTNIKGRENR